MTCGPEQNLAGIKSVTILLNKRRSGLWVIVYTGLVPGSLMVGVPYVLN